MVADRAADFDEHDVRRLLAIAVIAELAEPAFHLAGDVRDHLDIAPEVPAVAFSRSRMSE